MELSRWIAAIGLLLAAAGCSDKESIDPVPFECTGSGLPKGDRMLGMDILSPSETGTFDQDMERALAMRADFIEVHVPWDQIEPTAGNLVDPNLTLSLLNTVVAANGIKLSLTLKPIDLVGKTVPPDLATTRFNNPAMIARFKSMIDFVLDIVPPENLTSIQIGNEIDGYDTSGEHPDFWSDYGQFLFEMNSYVDATYPGLRIGFTGTFAGMTSGNLHDLGVFSALADTVDVVGITYYPLDAAFGLRSPAVVATDFATMTDTFAGRDIFVQEIGYHTPGNTAAADRDQAEFYCNAFAAWDAHPSIKALDLVRLNDLSMADAVELAGPYGISDAAFLEYLRTLGLRTYGGAGLDKPAVAVITEQATLRGF